MRWISLKEFRQRTQKENETVDDYIQITLNTGSDLNATGQKIVEAIVSGLFSHIKQ